ncbi:uroporphyrinogen-III C-methyltransferase [Zophobihabitans entericus]|uniref:Uncharacterized protein n=1 Tax=Zophobihabitans entericus TaxID=1635327 RepID=A0A6G9IBP3_9GAMM|nr:uroporphyrinogen-III C-methyltransferase [Zophobihabitans entericus]QIQ21252.1 hypothetical protein IPMB12_05875 [Zophobihabitans entericus]
MTDNKSLPENENSQQSENNSEVTTPTAVETESNDTSTSSAINENEVVETVDEIKSETVSVESETPADTKKANNKNNQKNNKSKKTDNMKEKEQQTDMQDTPAEPEKVKPVKVKAPVSKLSIVAILLTLGLAGGMYFHGHNQANQQKATIDQLQNELASIKGTIQQEVQKITSSSQSNQGQQLTNLQNTLNAQVSDQTKSQQQFMAQVNDALKVTEQNIQGLHEQLSAMSTTDNNIWLISQANYLVTLAGRKIWNDQDFITARLLLKSADASLAEANDPSLLPARQAINRDISALAKISYVDFDGIVMKLMTLADQITELPLVDHYETIELGLTTHDDSFSSDVQPSDDTIGSLETEPTSDLSSDEISFSIKDWSKNLLKSGQGFMEKFISIEKYDTFSECVAGAGQDISKLNNCQVYKALITPEQSMYLRENIRLQLFIAAQAIPRHQEEIYQRALSDVSVWVHAYFNTKQPNTLAFLEELDTLQQQPVSNKHLPEQLESALALDKLMQTRVRSLLSVN